MIHINLITSTVSKKRVCPHCGHIFIYRTRAILKYLYESALLDLDFTMHKTDCLNSMVKANEI